MNGMWTHADTSHTFTRKASERKIGIHILTHDSSTAAKRACEGLYKSLFNWLFIFSHRHTTSVSIPLTYHGDWPQTIASLYENTNMASDIRDGD